MIAREARQHFVLGKGLAAQCTLLVVTGVVGHGVLVPRSRLTFAGAFAVSFMILMNRRVLRAGICEVLHSAPNILERVRTLSVRVGGSTEEAIACTYGIFHCCNCWHRLAPEYGIEL